MKRFCLIFCLLFLAVVAIKAQAWMLIGSGSPIAGGGATNGEIGSTNIGGNTTSSYGLQYIQYYSTTPTSAGGVRYGHAYINDSNGENVRIILYNSSGEELLCCSGTIADNTPGWVNCDAGESETLVSETSYVLGEQGPVTIETQASGNNNYYNTNWAAGYNTCGSGPDPTGGSADYTTGAPTIIWNNTPGDPS